MAKNLWTREEMILAFNLYLKLPFGKMGSTHPEVIKLAKLIGRSNNAVAFRLVNYASCDPILKQRGIKGMENGRKQCQPYWDEFIDNKESLIYESERILARYQGTTIEEKYQEDIAEIPSGLKGETKIREIKARVNQNVFRQIVLANYDSKCALTGIDVTDLLVASHIIPWTSNEADRLNPENGICLSSLYDKAFDRGLISFTDSYTVIFSQRLKSNVGKEYYNNYFLPIEGMTLISPRKYNPNPTFLEWHRDKIFNQ